MIKNLLAMNDLQSEIFGEHLQGGIGDLQADGVIRVMVADEIYPRAHQVVADWEASQPAIEPGSKVKTKTSLGSLVLSFLLGGVAMFFLLQTPVSNDGIDHNGDGALDEHWHYAGNLLRKVKIDQNRDGGIDAIWNYDHRGLLSSSKYDNNFDGRFELQCKIYRGNTTSCKADFDNDGFAEYRESYRSGVLNSISFYNPKTKLIKKKKILDGGRLVQAQIDLDGDGDLETQVKYDRYEESLEP